MHRHFVGISVAGHLSVGISAGRSMLMSPPPHLGWGGMLSWLGYWVGAGGSQSSGSGV